MKKKKISKKVKTSKNTKAPSKKTMSKNCKKSCNKSCSDKKPESVTEYVLCGRGLKAIGESNPVLPSSSSFEPPKQEPINLWGKLKKFIGL